MLTDSVNESEKYSQKGWEGPYYPNPININSDLVQLANNAIFVGRSGKYLWECCCLSNSEYQPTLFVLGS